MMGPNPEGTVPLAQSVASSAPSPELTLPGALAEEAPGVAQPAMGTGETGSAAAGGAGPAGPAVLPSAADVLGAMRLVNAQFTANWPDPTLDIVTDRARPSNLWTRAVYFEGLMGLYAVEPDAALQKNYYDYAVRWGESPSHPWQVTNRNARTRDADSQACGQTYLDLYAIEPEPVRIAQVDASVRNLIDSGDTTAWWWIDALHMAMPIFARLGVLRNDTSYFAAMWNSYSHSRDVEGGGLFDPATGLWWRDADYTPGATYIRSPNGGDVYWSRGNGWVLAALARVLDVLPASEPHRPAYEADFRALAAALLPLQRTDGFWNTSLTDPAHCASAGEPGEDGPETSGTALFTYGFGWGIRHGLLDAETYGAAVASAWNGMVRTAVRADGFLGWVQPTGAAPCSGPEPLGPDTVPNFDDFGVGCFLLAGSEVRRLTSQ